MICSNCYESQISIKHDVGHWWNNPPGHVFVCSDNCYNELEQHVKNGTWMDRTFGSGNVMRKARKAKLKAATDKQFNSST